MPKMVQKTCTNPDCEFKDELMEDVRFCPECHWEVKPWKARNARECFVVERVRGVKQHPKEKQGQGLVCPNCGYEHPGQWSAYFAKVERMEAKREEKLRRLREGKGVKDDV